MSKLLAACILCNSTENLNTTEAKFVDRLYQVAICSKCEDDASPKKLREALTAKFEKFQTIIQSAKELGAELTIESLIGIGNNLAAPKATSAPMSAAPVASPAPVGPPKAVRLTDERGNRLPSQRQLVEYQTIGGEIPTDGQDVGTARNRAITIPSKIVEDIGVTHITVRKMSPSTFDRRFKDQAARSLHGDNISGKGAEYRVCQACAGQGWTGDKHNPQSCKPCDGTGSDK